MRPHPRRTITDPTNPEAWGTCDRSGFIAQQRNLQWQWEWGGTQLYNKRVLVAPDMLDEPQRQLGTIILPADPVAIENARPEPYYVEEQTFLQTQLGTTLISQNGTALLESNLQGTTNAGTYPG